MRTALVCGGNGFIGHHLARRLKSEGYYVVVADIKQYQYGVNDYCHEVLIGDLRKQDFCDSIFKNYKFVEVYQLAADMGGAFFIFTGENDFDIMHNSALINLNIAERITNEKVFYSSSACMYPAYNQEDPDNPNCAEDSCYPAAPDSEYGWEKLFSERLYMALARNKEIEVRIARFHNIFGEEGTYDGGREKYPAAICRKIAEANDGDFITIWGDGLATRSFLYIDECIEGVRRLMNSEYDSPVNIGSDEMISVAGLADMVATIADKKLVTRHDFTKPQGVRGRNSDNTLIKKVLGWSPTQPLKTGMEKLYLWVDAQIKNKW